MKGSYEAITHRTSPDIYDFYKLFDAGYWQVYIQETVASGTTKLSDTDEDIFQLKTTTVGLLNDLGCNGFTLSEDLINEMSQYDASELHAIASFVGEVASQEVIKLITRQFIPMSGNFIFNGVDHKSQLLLFTKPGSFRLHSSWQIAFLMENVKRKVCHATLDLQVKSNLTQTLEAITILSSELSANTTLIYHHGKLLALHEGDKPYKLLFHLIY
ncbi:hypothetical protein FXO38_03922 [Capsicum annuum]|nr:hypothetical protein FXO38_03922 [Capsicum annuum]